MNLETDNPEKGQLLEKSAHHRELLEEEVKLITEKSEKIITNALIIGGALAVTYLLVSSVSGWDKKEKSKSRKIKLVAGTAHDEEVHPISEPQEPGIVSQLGTVLAAQATGFLLSIAREKLVGLLQSQVTKKHDIDERSE